MDDYSDINDRVATNGKALIEQLAKLEDENTSIALDELIREALAWVKAWPWPHK